MPARKYGTTLRRIILFDVVVVFNQLVVQVGGCKVIMNYFAIFHGFKIFPGYLGFSLLFKRAYLQSVTVFFLVPSRVVCRKLNFIYVS